MRRWLPLSVLASALLAGAYVASVRLRGPALPGAASAAPAQTRARHAAARARADDASPNHALALAWGGSAQTALDASQLNSDHTLLLRFMAAYEAAFRGVALSDGSGSYHVGLAPYSALDGPALEVTIGGSTLTIALPDPVLTDNDFRSGVPRQRPARWRTLALSRRNAHVSVYLDGARLGELTPGAAKASGHVRLGRLAQRQSAQDQFYGFIDDVMLHDAALDDEALAQLSSSRTSALPAGSRHLDFEPSPAREAAISLLGGARVATLSAERDATRDSAELPKPAHQTRFTLPFSKDEVWLVIQGQNSKLSHNDVAAFALDFIRVDPRFVRANPSHRPGGSHAASIGAPALAAAAGRVSAVIDCFPDDNSGRCAGERRAPLAPSPANRNLVCVEHAPGESSCALHLRQHSAAVQVPQDIEAGVLLGRVGNTGVPSPHLHFAVSDRSEPNRPAAFSDLVTLPFQFSDYFVSDDFGESWRHVDEGTPRPGEWLSRALPTRD